MAIMVRTYIIIEGRCGHPNIVAKFSDDQALPFQLNDRNSMLQWLIKAFWNKRKVFGHGFPVAFEIFKLGGKERFVSYFPAYDEKGEKLPLSRYGRLEFHVGSSKRQAMQQFMESQDVADDDFKEEYKF